MMSFVFRDMFLVFLNNIIARIILIVNVEADKSTDPSLHPQPVSPNMRIKLDSEEQNAICCRNKLKCCRRYDATPYFEVKAVITSCPNQCYLNYTKSKKNVVVKNKTTTEKLTNCIQKLLLTIKMTNRGMAGDKSQYIIIDHITDPITLKKVGILNPYAVRIRQEPILQAFDLKFERVVNGEAKETVHDKNKRDYRGCHLGPKNPTCGVISHGGRMVPYSTGFCCSCTKEENDEDDGEVQWTDPHNYDGSQMVYNPQQKRKADHQSADGKAKVTKRQHRGGQSCDEFDINSLPRSFYETTHCLEFSDLWYSVYHLQKPRFIHKIKVQIFQKYEDCHGQTHWLDLTRGKVIDLGTEKPACNYKELNIIARYKPNDPDVCPPAIDYNAKRLLIPEKRVGDPGQFMVVNKKYISPDGKTCDTAGVGYEAFYKQKKRCFKPQGSCLKNQPVHFEQEDQEAEENGKKGQYFLKNYGIFTDNPVLFDSRGQLISLHMYFIKKHVSTLYFELNADLVTLLQANSFATITEVYTDATDTKKTRIIVKVTNSGLLYGVYYVRLSGCPLDVPASFNNIASKSVLIPAQHQHIFNLYIEYPLPVNELICSIHVHNVNQELKARREIRIRARDRCICIWHCECACYVTDGGLKCTPIALEAYHEAGFQGGLPLPTQLIEPSYLDEALALFLHMLVILFITLLIMGMIKALLGLCFRSISMWGLDTILGTEEEEIDSSTGKVICDNKDCEYRDDGISLAAQFCLNVMFFFLYPLALMNICLRKMCFSSYTVEGDGSCDCLDNNDDFCNDEKCPAGKRRLSNMMDSTEEDDDDEKSVGNRSSKDGHPISMKYSTDDSNKVASQTEDDEDVDENEDEDQNDIILPPAIPPSAEKADDNKENKKER